MLATNIVTSSRLETDHDSAHDLMSELNTFQRILLVADGTVTELLEQYLGERIKVSKLLEHIETDYSALSGPGKKALQPDDLPVLRRKVFLQGQSTMNNWMFADSFILFNNLAPDFRRDLLHSNQPIGKLWVKYRLETFKTIIDVRKESDDSLVDSFGLRNDTRLIGRTYCVYSRDKLIMVITEKFPLAFFKKGIHR